MTDDGRVWNAMSFITLNSNEDKFLILKRADDDECEPGKWCIPGGGVESGETFEECMFREVYEETHCEIEKFDYFKSILVGGRLRVIYFFGTLIDELGVKMNYEHSDFAWISFDEIDNYDFAFNQDKLLKEFIDNYFNLGCGDDCSGGGCCSNER